MMRLKSLYLGGFKSFDAPPPMSVQGSPYERGRPLVCGDITVLLGANGAGKSNVVSFFKMLAAIATAGLQTFVGEAGTAESIFHYGSKTTPLLGAEIELVDGNTIYAYNIMLKTAPPDTLTFVLEDVRRWPSGRADANPMVLQTGHRESQLEERAAAGDEICQSLLSFLRRCKVYQFHDTSIEARIRKSVYIEDARFLRSDAGNLAAYLYTMQQAKSEYYGRIVRTIRQVCPQFHDFDLAPSAQNDKYIILNWKSAGHTDYLMGPHQLSDGTLRFMALATVLLQPPDKIPAVIVLDEPELGLHPSAISVLADLVRGASMRSQVILATQSPTLVNHFTLDQIRPIEFRNGCSVFLDMNADDYASWLEDYTTGELWQKNVLGRNPRHG
jgi:predicted ATPase